MFTKFKSTLVFLFSVFALSACNPNLQTFSGAAIFTHDFFWRSETFIVTCDRCTANVVTTDQGCLKTSDTMIIKDGVDYSAFSAAFPEGAGTYTIAVPGRVTWNGSWCDNQAAFTVIMTNGGTVEQLP